MLFRNIQILKTQANTKIWILMKTTANPKNIWRWRWGDKSFTSSWRRSLINLALRRCCWGVIKLLTYSSLAICARAWNSSILLLDSDIWILLVLSNLSILRSTGRTSSSLLLLNLQRIALLHWGLWLLLLLVCIYVRRLLITAWLYQSLQSLIVHIERTKRLFFLFARLAEENLNKCLIIPL